MEFGTNIKNEFHTNRPTPKKHPPRGMNTIKETLSHGPFVINVYIPHYSYLTAVKCTTYHSQWDENSISMQISTTKISP